jgi:iron complex outermembrane receptor protein
MLRKHKLALVLVSALSGSMPAWAQSDAAPEQPASSGDIIVTARRVEERLQDVPIAITVFNQTQLAQHNVLNADDLAKVTPGLQVDSSFGSDNSMFSIRGFTQNIGSAPTVGTYFADVVAPRSGNFATPAGDGAGPGTFFDLQNVQILKGPQGTLQGRNTTGGAVMLVPQKPTDKLEGYVEGTLGDYSAKGIQGVINIPIGDTFRMRIGVDRQKRDGDIINYSGVGPRDYNDVNYTAVRASFVADLAPNLENYTIVSYSNSHNNGTVQKLIATSVNNTGELEGFANDQLQRQAALGFYGALTSMPVVGTRTNTWQVINTTTWQATDSLTFKNIVSYAQYHQKQQAPLFGTDFVVNNANGLANLEAVLNYDRATGQLTGPDPSTIPSVLATLQGLAATPGLGFNYTQGNPYPGLNNSSEATFTEEFQVQGHGLDGKLDFQGGVYVERATPLGTGGNQTTVFGQCQDINSPTPNCVSPLAIAVNAYNNATTMNPYQVLNGGYNPGTYRNTLSDTALYFQATYKFTPKLSLTGGFRYTWDSQSNVVNPNFIGFQANPTGLPTPLHFCIATASPAPAGGTCDASDSSKSSAPTWLIDVDWKPIENVLLYAKYARGYRAGGDKPDISQFVSGPLFTANTPQTYQIDKWTPEKLDAFEVGLKSSWRGAVSGTFNVSGFYNKFSNQQIQLGLSAITAPTPGESTIFNAAKSRIFGVEVDTTLNLFRGFVLSAGYAYLNSKVESIDIPSGVFALGQVATPLAPLAYVVSTAEAGKPLTYSPRNKFTINGQYTLPLNDPKIGLISFGATFTHTDSQYSTFVDAGQTSETIDNGELVTSTTDYGILQATNLVDVNASWRDALGSPVDVSFFMTNVTGQKYYTATPGLLGLGFEVASIGAPRMYGFRAKVHF